MARVKIPYKTTTIVRVVAPRDVSVNPHVVLNDAAGASSTFKVYDEAKDESFSAAEAAAQTIWSVTNAAAFKIGDVVEATETNGTILEGTLTGVDPTNGTITSDTALAVGAAEGARVRVRLGSQVSMTEYGTASLNDREWGYQGAILSTHAGLDLDTEVNIEISFKGAADNSLDQLRLICGEIKTVEECEG